MLAAYQADLELARMCRNLSGLHPPAGPLLAVFAPQKMAGDAAGIATTSSGQLPSQQRG
jgi:hypothetical protein